MLISLAVVPLIDTITAPLSRAPVFNSYKWSNLARLQRANVSSWLSQSQSGPGLWIKEGVTVDFGAQLHWTFRPESEFRRSRFFSVVRSKSVQSVLLVSMLTSLVISAAQCGLLFKRPTLLFLYTTPPQIGKGRSDTRMIQSYFSADYTSLKS